MGPYDSPLGARIRRLKYNDETIWASRLGRALSTVFLDEWQDATLLPVPLHPNRLADRGYNQSALLARHVAAARRLRVQTGGFFRVQATAAQAQLDLEDRATNVRSAFRAHPGMGSERYVLLDDVATTGSTLDACAQALDEVGAEVVGALACALGRSLRAEAPPRV